METLNTQRLDALERASSRLDTDPRARETDADAAAGRSRACSFDADTRSSASSRPDLHLPVQGSGKSSIGCAQLAQLERALADTTLLQSRATAALERIARQQSALKRIPVACPSCGCLNVPQGSAWHTGDLVSCQECSQPFLPLSSFQVREDLAVLKSAVQRLRDQQERIQYLECLAAKGRQESTSPLAKSAKTPASEPAEDAAVRKLPARGPMASPLFPPQIMSPRQVGQGPPTDSTESPDASPEHPFLSPCSPCQRLQRVGLHELEPILQESPSAGGATSSSPRLMEKVQDRSNTAGEAASPLRAGQAGDKPLILMPLLDTQDLLTNSSSSSAPLCFHGSKLSKWQMDTEQKTREALQQMRHKSFGPKGRARKEREEGEIASASESEGSRLTSWDARPGSLVAGHQALQKGVPAGTPAKKEDKKNTGAVMREHHPRPTASVVEAVGAFPKWFLLMLLACFLAVAFIRHLLHRLAQRLQGEAVASAVLTAIVTGTAMHLWRHAEEMVQKQNMLETSRGEWKHGIVCLERTFMGSTLQLNLEEALGLSAALAQLAPVFLFENWGIYGPPACRWAAVVAHVATAIIVMVGVRNKLLNSFCTATPASKDPAPEVLEVCVGLAVGNWAASSWAASTWWHLASSSSAIGLQVRLPVLALACAQLTNFWLARRSRQPHLLAVCVALGGLSMAKCCCGAPGMVLETMSLSSSSSLLMTSGIYVLFCAVSALLLFQELFNSL
ncbi:unnamed protein product [Symbiodinium natans]|uniref:Transmembrane protein n=1 Tax=Symbiodinium natans TaxID=878477 RepID=A0A812H5C6_9DINO|nr:unnamed protein product [Symbiodinium natans]